MPPDKGPYFAKGRMAKKRKKPYTANPYARGTLQSREWMDGWKSIKRKPKS